jgi:hypothetical protein
MGESATLQIQNTPPAESELMDLQQVYLQAQGLQHTAERAIEGGNGNNRPQSIVITASLRLIADAAALKGEANPLAPPMLKDDTTWAEVLTIAETVRDWSKHRIEREREFDVLSERRHRAI